MLYAKDDAMKTGRTGNVKYHKQHIFFAWYFLLQ
jgi:hypothetical protein